MATTYEEMKTFLEGKSYNVYAPMQKENKCESEYLVIRGSGTTTLNGNKKGAIFEILCYVPANKYSRLDALVEEVSQHMKGMYPLVRSTNYESPDFFDDQKKAHMKSLQYINYREGGV